MAARSKTELFNSSLLCRSIKQGLPKIDHRGSCEHNTGYGYGDKR